MHNATTSADSPRTEDALREADVPETADTALDLDIEEIDVADEVGQSATGSGTGGTLATPLP